MIQRAIFRWFLPTFIGVISLVSCNSSQPETEEEEQPVYTFISAGHVYGNSETFTGSVYPPFLKKIDSVLVERKVDLLVLTGDVVPNPTPENWETARAELDALPVGEWVIAPGNHDISPYMDEHIQSEKYMALTKHDALFLTLNTSFPGWTVDSAQAVFIEKELNEATKARSVFVFSHQLWWEKNPPAAFDLDSLRPNSFALFDGDRSFWDDAFPYFEATGKEVYFFAGDMGCHYSLAGYYEDHYKDFHFYGSGMGGAVEDNFIIGSLFQDGSVKIERIDF